MCLIQLFGSIGSIAGSLGQHVEMSAEGKPEYTSRTVVFMKVLITSSIDDDIALQVVLDKR